MIDIGDEDVETQLDRLNAAIAKTLEAARLPSAQPSRPDSSLLSDSFQEIEISHNRLDFSRIGGDEGLYVFTEPGLHCGESFTREDREYLDVLLLQLERTQMQLEDTVSAAFRAGGLLHKADIDREELPQLFDALNRLETAHFAQIRIGHIHVAASLRENEELPLEEEDGAITRRSLEDDHDESQIVWQMIKQQKAALDAREQSLCAREAEFQAELSAFELAKRCMEEEHERFVEAAKQQTTQALTLKDRIELLLHDQQESTFDLSSVYASDVAAVKGQYAEYEAELESLRKQIAAMRLEGSDSSIIKKEMELAEDILVGVVNGDDPRKLHVQVTVVKNKLVHIRGKQVIRDAEKMASSINSTICALEGSRLSLKSKNRIKEQVMQRLKSPVASPQRVGHAEKGRPLSLTKPLTLSLECLTSPLDTPIAHSRQVSMYIPRIEINQISTLDTEVTSQLRNQEARTNRLRNRLQDMQTKLERYKTLEKRMIEDRTQIKIAEKRILILKETLDEREKRLMRREMEVAEKEDMLRNALAKSLSTKEARELLNQKCMQLTDLSQKLAKDANQVDLSRGEIKLAREEIHEYRLMLDKENRKIVRDFALIDRERKKIIEYKKELAEFLPKLQNSRYA